ncbi:MAG: hypothetical protein O3A46_17555 [Candidatus Poribacteria bacterium]|nr:hypothetical protein [Candidatus Poribacteria bacterium]
MIQRQLTGWLAAAFALLVSAGATAQSPESVQVFFSAGKVEVLQSGMSEWQFVRTGMLLNRTDLVRMPPVSLLRFQSTDGAKFALLSGLRERNVGSLVDEALTLEAETPSARPAADGGTPVVDVLPAGDARATVGVQSVVALTPEQIKRWRALKGNSPLVRLALETARHNVANNDRPTIYPTPRVQLLSALFEVAENASKDRLPIGSLYPEGDASKLFLMTALIDAAGIQTERAVTDDGVPYLLVRSAVSPESHRVLTANRRLIHVDSTNRVWMPFHPTQEFDTFLEAWYAGEIILRTLPESDAE